MATVLVVGYGLRHFSGHIPFMRLFYGSGSAKSHVFQCEITEAGAEWSSPYWRLTENGQLREIKGVGGGGLDADGRFTRWSVVTLGSEKSLSVTCLCRHNHTGVIIQTDTVDMFKGKIYENRFLYVG